MAKFYFASNMCQALCWIFYVPESHKSPMKFILCLFNNLNNPMMRELRLKGE